ncbi:DJ-1/PfpI family protein [uncultured Friedmanniella sp.]|uniref:DJ-1/PfpI family protein n=1 Tax=uncultured Friedmanniella sp. TaxID=335381 RepID=UPI0035CA3B51
MTSTIAIIVFDGFDEIDVFGPFEILSSAGFDVHLAALSPGRVTSMRGVELSVPRPLEGGDGLVVPGGGWLNRAPAGAWGEAQRGELPHRLVELAPSVRWLASVCSGGMLLATAGLLQGRPATTNRACFEEFRPLVGEVIDERVVDDGDRITAGALFSGVDLGLWITKRELGTEAADRVSAGTEYARQGRVWQATNGVRQASS